MPAMSVEEFLQITENMTQDGVRVRSYSGRGMYGAECVAITCDGVSEIAVVADMFSAAAYLFEPEDLAEKINALADILIDTRTDDMGLGSVIYWPCLDWPEGRPDYSDEDEE